MIDVDRVQWFAELEQGDEVAIRAHARHLPRTADHGRWYRAIVMRRDKRGCWVRRVGSSVEVRLVPTSTEYDARPWSPADDARELALTHDQSIRDWLRGVVFVRREDGRFEGIPSPLRAELLALRERMVRNADVG